MWAQSMYYQVHQSIWLSGGVSGGPMACQEVLVITSTTQPSQVLGGVNHGVETHLVRYTSAGYVCMISHLIMTLVFLTKCASVQ